MPSMLGKLSKLKNGEIFETVQKGGGRQKIQKIPSFSWEKFKIRGGVFGNQKSPKFQTVLKTNRIMSHFHLMRTQKRKILSIVVLNNAKYTIISIILNDCVPIFFIFNFCHLHFGLIPKFCCFFDWKASLIDSNLFGKIANIFCKYLFI